MFEESVHLQDVLLVIALGHDLEGSKSLFAMLPKEIMQSILAREIERCYWDFRSSIGLLTPTEISVSRCNHIVTGKSPFEDLEFRRAPIASVVSCPQCPVQSKENRGVPFSKSTAFQNLTTPTISNFIANRYNDLFRDADDGQNLTSTDGALFPRSSNPAARKVFRRMNDDS
jgi:hypothetical protein